jgi:hypothetical protein
MTRSFTTAGPALLPIGSPAALAAPTEAAAAPEPELPAAVRAVMDKPRYADAGGACSWPT